MPSATYGVFCLYCGKKIEIPFSDSQYQEKALEFIKRHRDCDKTSEYNKDKSCNCTCSCRHICYL